MTDILIEKHNAVVQPDNTTLFLGDVFWGRKSEAEARLSWARGILGRMNGRKILVRGNHDRMPDAWYLEAGFAAVRNSPMVFLWAARALRVAHSPAAWIPAYRSLDIDQVRAVTSSWHTLHFCGHVHNLWTRLGALVNVGVDAWRFAPVALEKAMAIRQCKGIVRAHPLSVKPFCSDLKDYLSGIPRTL